MKKEFLFLLYFLNTLTGCSQNNDKSIVHIDQDTVQNYFKNITIDDKVEDPIEPEDPFFYSTKELIKLIEPALQDKTFINVDYTHHFFNEINLLYTAFTLDSTLTLVYNRNTAEILDTVATPIPKNGESVRSLDIKLLDSIHVANGFELLPKLKADRAYGIITGRKQKIQAALIRGGLYYEMFLKKFEEENIPQSLIAKFIFESGFDNRAKSWAGASGIFQFTKPTAESFGLDIVKENNRIILDERYNVQKTLDAYVSYMNKAFSKFPDKNLIALTSYNTGYYSKYFNDWQNRDEIDVIKEMGFAPRYYFASLVASLRVMKDAHKIFSDLWIPKPNNHTCYTEKDVKGKKLETYLGMDKEKIRKLNPQFRKGFFESNYVLKKSYIINIK